ncbi:DnaB-like helicase N-terminal domain-containing protein, partial [Bacillus sp. JJ1127]|uniref:DnaB-like helicase N-terminal domain-containing protein n=1 Tax=Bacillus sp. JJ1127 TaxID=3122952 RepID=UPI003F68AC79
SLLLDGELTKGCHLTERHFSTAVHQVIFKLIRKIKEDGQQLDFVTLVSKMESLIFHQQQKHRWIKTI